MAVAGARPASAAASAELLSQARDIDDLQILLPALVAGAAVEATDNPSLAATWSRN